MPALLACRRLDVLAGLDLRVQRQARQGRLRTVRGDLADLTDEIEADIDVAVAVNLDALWRLRDRRIEAGDGLNLRGIATRRDEEEDHGQWNEYEQAHITSRVA